LKKKLLVGEMILTFKNMFNDFFLPPFFLFFFVERTRHSTLLFCSQSFTNAIAAQGRRRSFDNNFLFFFFTVQSPKPCMKLDLFIYLFVLVGWYFNRTREIIVIVFK
jgi:hypothetical protein